LAGFTVTEPTFNKGTEEKEAEVRRGRREKGEGREGKEGGGREVLVKVVLVTSSAVRQNF